MPEQPDGKRWVSREKGRPVTAKKYHLYKDCGTIRGLSIEQFDIIEVQDRDVDLLGLNVCVHCDRRSHVMTYEEILVGAVLDRIRGVDVSVFSVSGAPIEEWVSGLVLEQIDRLRQNGYAIRQDRKVWSQP